MARRNTPRGELPTGTKVLYPVHEGPQRAFMESDAEEVLYGGAAFGGKATRMSALVYTPFGPKQMGDIQIGDAVCTPDGSVAKVIQIHPQGQQQLYRITFDDGSTTEVTEGHLWLTWQGSHGAKKAGKRRFGAAGSKIRTTKQLIEHLAQGVTSLLIPLTEPVYFAPNNGRWGRNRPVDPYLLGVLIGDGCLTQEVTFASADPFIPEKLRSLTTDSVNKLSSSYGYSITGGQTRAGLQALGLMGHRAETKFLPKIYQVAPLAVRLALMNGLMDTDGYIDTRGHASYCTVSPQLAKDVQWLAWSLGYKASITEKPTTGQLAYNIEIMGRDSSDLCSLPRKKARGRRRGLNQQETGRQIVSVAPTEIDEAQCITIDHPSGLYLTDDFIVTHNSYALRAYLVSYCLEHPGATTVLFRRTFRELEDTHIIALQNELPTTLAEYKSSSHDFLFKNGSILMCRFMEKESDARSYDTFEADAMAFDELTAFSEFQYVYLVTRCRSVKPWWPGRRIRSATNPGNVGHCLPYGDVLTPDGWRRIEEVRKGDLVASLDDADQLVYVPVDHTCQHEYHGPLMISDTGTAHIACTPYHKIARRTETKRRSGRTLNGVTLTPAQDLPKTSRLIRTAQWDQPDTDWCVTPTPVSGCRTTKLHQPESLSGDLYCELLGWMVSEGFTVDRDKEFGIAQTKPANRDRIHDLLVRCGFSFRESPTAFNVSSPMWWQHFSTLGKCREKNVPGVIKQKATRRQLELFLTAAMLGDGHGTHYYTTSHQLANDMQEIAFKLGRNPRITSRQRPNRVGLSYDVNLRTRSNGELKKSSFDTVSFDGPVYCLGIDRLHRFFVRQKGRIWLSGNSWVRQRFIDFCRPYEIKRGPINEGRMLRQFIPAFATDNTTGMAADPGYIDILRGLPWEEYRAKALGDWDIFAGQFFQRWRNDVHVCPQFTPSPEWKRYITVDWGLAAPRAVYWGARPPMGQDFVWLYREQYGAGVPTREQARLVKEAVLSAGEQIEVCVMDPATFAREKDADGNLMQSVAGIFTEALADICPVIRGNNERILGASLFREVLDWTGTEGQDGSVQVLVPPRLKVMDNCREFIRTVPGLIHSPNNAEDVDTSQEDHAYDSVRYLLRYLFDAPKRPRARRIFDTPEGLISVA